MVEAVTNFISENLALCVILGVLLVIVGDEVLGLSRGLLGDEADNLPATPAARKQPEEINDPIESAQPGDTPIDAFLTPPEERPPSTTRDGRGD